ncbi:MAG: HEAT repeat domain-containing protein, partial [Promethearchaeota archaeon]
MGKDKKFRPDPNMNPYMVRQTPSPPKRAYIDFNTRRICPACGRDIKITHNFCKYCGVDLSAIEPIGRDEISKQLAITAVTDPDPEVRKEAVDTLGDFEDNRVLGVLTYVLLNDPDENVRKEAADELGNLHHPLSLDTLAKALKDESAIVRKEAIEGLKKIKKLTKPKEKIE